MPSISITDLIGILNLKDFGAKGDGNSDTAPALRAAEVAAGQGGIIFVPPGTYKLTNNYSLAAGTTLVISRGATFTGGTVLRGNGTLISLGQGEIDLGGAAVRNTLSAGWTGSTGPAVPGTTANTYGSALSIYPTTGYASIEPVYIALYSSGTFGSETLTIRVRSLNNYGQYAEVTKTFTSVGSQDLTSADLASLMSSGAIVGLFLDCKSTINNSAARGNIQFAFWNR